MRLALAFGRPDVDRFLQGLSAREYDAWQEYFLQEPFGWHALALGVAQVAAILAAAHGGEARPLEEYLARWERRRPQDAEDQRAAMDLVVQVTAAADKG